MWCSWSRVLKSGVRGRSEQAHGLRASSCKRERERGWLVLFSHRRVEPGGEAESSSSSLGFSLQRTRARERTCRRDTNDASGPTREVLLFLFHWVFVRVCVCEASSLE